MKIVVTTLRSSKGDEHQIDVIDGSKVLHTQVVKTIEQRDKTIWDLQEMYNVVDIDIKASKGQVKQKKEEFRYTQIPNIPVLDESEAADFFDSESVFVFERIVKAIEEAREEQRKIYEVNRERHYRDLATIRNRALQENNFSAAVQAEKARGQAAGLYIERKEVRHGSIDAMSRDEVEEKIKQILGENGKLIEMVPQESNEEEVDTSEDRT